MKTFQKPLTLAEEQYYLKQYQNGDSQAKDILIEHNLRLVAHVVKKYQGLDEDLDDLISIGTIGLIKAISTFDSRKATRLSTYAARCIDNELLMMLRSRKKRSREISLYEPIGTDKEGNEISLLDIVESPVIDVVENYTRKEDTRRLLSLVKNRLNEKEYQVLCYRYGLFGQEEKTQREIAAQLGISRSYVSRIEKNAVLKLKKLFHLANE
ncbi:MAG TPA: RNA polymerase sporulation sigma factor SigK [Candidatus Blautia avistercoris]|nr:RNA polymerase sporulation sigma factor SigK [Candidatus Blautia avistercoris]